MDVCSLLPTIIFLIIFKITFQNDFFESFRPKEDNPQELNEFLSNVLEHRQDFSFVNQAAKKYRKIRKNTRSVYNLDNYLSADNNYKVFEKRHINHKYPAKSKHLKRRWKDYNFNRFRRDIDDDILDENDYGIQKRMPTIENELEEEKHLPSDVFVEPDYDIIGKRSPSRIVVESEGEKGYIRPNNAIKKAILNDKRQIIPITPFSQPVHKTYKSHKYKNTYKVENKHKDYADLQDFSKMKQEEKSNNRRQNNYWNPYKKVFSNKFNNQPMEYEPWQISPQHTVNDEINYEKALSYEVDPKYSEENNADGNDLYSVNNDDNLDNIQSLDLQENRNNLRPPNSFNMLQLATPPADPEQPVTNERFFIDDNKNLLRIDNMQSNVATKANELSQNPTVEILENNKRTIKHLGKGFIDITANNQKNIKESPYTFKHSLHPLQVKDLSNQNQFQMRKLLFANNEDLKSYNTDEYYDEAPKRYRRDFLDAIGMKNEEDYSEDNPYKSEMTVNNTDVQNHTHTPNTTIISTINSCIKIIEANINKTNTSSLREKNVKQIKNILDEPKEMTGDTTMIGSFSTEREVTRTKKSLKINNKRRQRDVASDISHKILKNKNRIINQQQHNHKHKKPLEVLNQYSANDLFYKSPVKKRHQWHQIHKNEDYNTETEILGTSDKPETLPILDFATTSVDTFSFIEHESKQPINRPSNSSNFVEIGGVQNLETLDVTQENNVLMSSNEPQAFSSLPNIVDQVSSFKSNSEISEIITTTFFSDTTPTLDSPELNPVNSSYEKMIQEMDAENEKLAQVVNGHLAHRIVSAVWEEMKKKASLKTKFYTGLSKKHQNFASGMDFDVFSTNGTENNGEARLLLKEITKVLNKLVWTQVRRKLCQQLPEELKTYLNTLVENRDELETNRILPNANQGRFLFTPNQQPRFNTKPTNNIYNHIANNKSAFNLNMLQATLINLENLLLNYYSLNDECKSRAAPVKNFIEKHIQVLRKIVACPGNNCEDKPEKTGEAKRNIPFLQNDLVEEQLESIGLGNKGLFVPNFDLNKLVKNKLEGNNWSWKSNRKRDISYENYKTHQFEKLERAAKNLREKRDNELKIARLFGAKKKRSLEDLDIDYEDPVVYNLE